LQVRFRAHSASSSSFLIISRTSLKPPLSLWTRLGLLSKTSSALSCFPLLGPGLAGRRFLRGLDSTSSVAEFCVGISSHSSFAISSFLRKKGQRSASISRESLASAREMGTVDDLITAWATSDVGNARRLRDVGVAVDATGEEKSLGHRFRTSRQTATLRSDNLHPYTFRDAVESPQLASASLFTLSHLHELIWSKHFARCTAASGLCFNRRRAERPYPDSFVQGLASRRARCLRSGCSGCFGGPLVNWGGR
jgi:hypothetical protein